MAIWQSINIPCSAITIHIKLLLFGQTIPTYCAYGRTDYPCCLCLRVPYVHISSFPRRSRESDVWYCQSTTGIIF